VNDSRWPLALLNTGAFLLCVGFLVYVLCILRPFLRRPPVVPGYKEDFDWHLVVPCLNEAEVVEATVRHLLREFPYATVWCVDDASDDETPYILERLAAESERLRVISRALPHARQGKGPALNAAWEAIGNELPADADPNLVIVGVIDADGRLDPYCPDVISGPKMFADRSVGAIQIQVRVTQDVDGLVGTNLLELSASPMYEGQSDGNRDPLLVRLQDLEFTGPIAAMQVLRRRTGSVGMGGNGQFTRLSALDRVALEHGTPWHGALLEDFELGLHVLLSGYRTEYADDTYVAQTGLTTVRPLIRQRSRWAQGGIQCARYLWRVMSSPEVPLSGALEIAYYLYVPWSQLLGSIVFPVTIGIDLWYVFHTGGSPMEWVTAGAWGVAPLALIFGILPQLIWGPIYRARTGFVSMRQALFLGLANIAYGYLLQAAVWWALIRILRGRSDWKKTARTAVNAELREPHLARVRARNDVHDGRPMVDAHSRQEEAA
jgi:1,2-diacylglycerol 3-beta-glucosyltransferase